MAPRPVLTIMTANTHNPLTHFAKTGLQCRQIFEDARRWASDPGVVKPRSTVLGEMQARGGGRARSLYATPPPPPGFER